MDQLFQHISPIDFSALAGILGTFVVSVITRAHWSQNTKRLVALAVYVALAAATFLFIKYPAFYQFAIMNLGVVAGAGQIAYTVLKPTGLMDWVRDVTSPPAGRHRAPDNPGEGKEG